MKDGLLFFASQREKPDLYCKSCPNGQVNIERANILTGSQSVKKKQLQELVLHLMLKTFTKP